MPWCGAPRLNWDRCARRSAALPPRVPSAGLRRQLYRPAAAARDSRLQQWQLQPQLQQQQSPPEQHQYSGRSGGGEDGLCAKAARGLRSPASFGTYKRRQLQGFRIGSPVDDSVLRVRAPRPFVKIPIRKLKRCSRNRSSARTMARTVHTQGAKAPGAQKYPACLRRWNTNELMYKDIVLHMYCVVLCCMGNGAMEPMATRLENRVAKV